MKELGHSAWQSVLDLCCGNKKISFLYTINVHLTSTNIVNQLGMFRIFNMQIDFQFILVGFEKSTQFLLYNNFNNYYFLVNFFTISSKYRTSG